MFEMIGKQVSYICSPHIVGTIVALSKRGKDYVIIEYDHFAHVANVRDLKFLEVKSVKT